MTHDFQLNAVLEGLLKMCPSRAQALPDVKTFYKVFIIKSLMPAHE